MSPLLSRLVDEYPEDVRVIYRHLPLISIHPSAKFAAIASEAAGLQGKFWEYHDLMYERQTDLKAVETAPLPFFIELAEALELDVDQFVADFQSEEVDAFVEKNMQEAAAVGLTSTPTLIVNGQPLQGIPPYEAWVEFIEASKEQQAVMAELAEMQYEAYPEMLIDENATYLATVEMESGDSFVIELYPQSAPLAVNNFVFLAQAGWYDGVTFHRVLPGFVAQTGDPTGTGQGGPGYQFDNEIDPDLTHAAEGVVAMANSGPDTNGSQWYVTLGDASFLDGGYTIFGQVISGIEVVQSITLRDPASGPDLPDGDRITSVTIEVSE